MHRRTDQEAFTRDIDVWYARGPHSFNYPDRAVGVTLEPGVGGRWREVWRDGDGYEMGRSWPGNRAAACCSATAAGTCPRTR